MSEEETTQKKVTPEQLAVSENQTREHIATVQHYMRRFAFALLERAEAHDQSKLAEPEASAFALANSGDFLKNTTYGSDEYKESIRKHLGPALEHHYAANRHHPEHYEHGINQMDLVDVVEMFCDWKAAGERHADGCIRKSIEINKDRFDIEPQLVDVLRSTASTLEAMDW